MQKKKKMLQFRETYIEKRNFYALMEPIDIKNISINHYYSIWKKMSPKKVLVNSVNNFNDDLNSLHIKLPILKRSVKSFKKAK